MDFWYLRTSHRATVLGLYLWGFFCSCWFLGSLFPPPEVVFFFFFSCLDVICLRGALPLPGNFGWFLSHSSSLLSGRGEDCKHVLLPSRDSPHGHDLPCIPMSILFSSLVLSCRPPPIHMSCHRSYGTWSSFYLGFSLSLSFLMNLEFR